MPHVPPVVAYVDAQGRLLCVPCAEDQPMRDGELPRAPMHADNSALDGEQCETCGTLAKFDPKLRLPVSWDSQHSPVWRPST